VLLVRTTVKESPIHGLGLFADQFIAEGTPIWRLDPLLDRIIPEAELGRYPAHVVDYLEVYAEYFPELGVLVLSGDNDRFTNHADQPNTVVVLPNAPEAEVRAARDIEPGEEITCDYGVIRTRRFASWAAEMLEAAANTTEEPRMVAPS
jgi:SET domain-containing protein